MKLVARVLIGLIFVLVVCSPTVLGWRSFKVIFTSFPFQFNADYLDMKLNIQNDTGDTSINIQLNFLDDFDDIYLRYTVALEANEGNYTALINRTVNLCQFLKQRSSEPFLKVIYEDILKQGNFVKICPIRKGQYHVHEYRVDEEMLPSYVPETNFLVTMQLDLSNWVNLFKGTLHGRIDKSKGFNNLKMFSMGK